MSPPPTPERKSTSTQPSSSVASHTSTIPVFSRLLTTALPWYNNRLPAKIRNSDSTSDSCRMLYGL